MWHQTANNNPRSCRIIAGFDPLNLRKQKSQAFYRILQDETKTASDDATFQIGLKGKAIGLRAMAEDLKAKMECCIVAQRHDV